MTKKWLVKEENARSVAIPNRKLYFYREMKLKHAILILAAGYCMDFIGTWAKITHQSWANGLLFWAAVAKCIAVILIAFKLLRNPFLKDLMND